jgi:hypothetical protein
MALVSFLSFVLMKRHRLITTSIVIHSYTPREESKWPSLVHEQTVYSNDRLRFPHSLSLTNKWMEDDRSP